MVFVVGYNIVFNVTREGRGYARMFLVGAFHPNRLLMRRVNGRQRIVPVSSSFRGAGRRCRGHVDALSGW